jgi:uncharacterized protein (DUF1499 family)
MTTILIFTAVLASAALLVILAVLATHVEDWHRDLTTNFAATDDQSPDDRMRPLRTSLDPAALADRIEVAVRTLANWKLESRTSDDGRPNLHYVRSTRLMRFKDDIHVRIEPLLAGGSVLHADSRSRVGKGDLGQNPRNLRELLAAVRQSIQ